ncbi:splicing factor 3a subunit 3 [Encephalitozoon intestinalis ATCC 50506]|uniref:Splicing factor 3a subunit 3 n=1 Tax=Encephalitozoon intestinalis (strain ATCC 50506) TaxID=876142 RepID=E0S838_ENCIT|nr:splicing factor 3a subunit 3 [Encephalitozoon intestinalis ATCC 50506]ADM11873.1 splicing factor 3a subunit 3 [Encephalitozoon intestinalis ATCC 50506]UTX45629.1 DUF3449 domain-containing protein [Encephalitozoon intestinalis]
MDRCDVRKQVKILENMERISNWLIEMGGAKDKKDKMVKRYVRNILKRKYKRYKRMGVLNIEGKLDGGVGRLSDLGYYELKARKEVEEVLRDSKLCGSGLELERIFKEYMDVHLCSGYKEFLRWVHKLEADKTKFRYLEYLNELKEYLCRLMKIKYFRMFKRLMASRMEIIKKIEAQRYIEKDFTKEGGFPKVYCLGCSREVAGSVLKYHLKGKKHSKKGDGEVLYSDIETLEAENLIRRAFSVLDRERKYSISLFSRRKKLVGDGVPKWKRKQKDLDIEFECEICGYLGYGRDGFDRHFGEDLHRKCVEEYGIRYSPIFKGITRIGTLIRMKDRVEESESYSEEFEDRDGNVFDRRTYEDLKRNNLI